LPGLTVAAAVALLLAGCATAPSRPQAAGVVPQIPEPVAVTSSVPPAPEPPPPGAAPDTTAERQARGEAYTDVLARMRSGFALEDIDEPRIDRELEWYLRHPDYIERTLNRAAPYLHFIVSEVERRGLPLELAVLPVIESAFEPYAYSRARAAGLWQFIPATGTRFGLKQNWWYDGRRDVVSATRAALDYLEWLANMFNGDWLLAIAAYNCSEMAVDRQVKANLAAGKPIDFWNLKLPAETRAYVPRLLAMSRLVNKPANYGLEFSDISNQPYFVPVETGGQIDMAVAAELSGLSTADLYALNPAFHRFATDPTGPHFLLLPVEVADTFRQNLLQLTPDQRMRVERYDTRKGDTVASIAKRFATSAGMIQELNGIAANAKLDVDTELRVPSAVISLPPKVLAAAALVDGKSAFKRSTARHVHVVARGDSLANISRKTGVPVATLVSLNGLKPSEKLRAGQKLNLGSEAGTDEYPVKPGKADKAVAKAEKPPAKLAKADKPAKPAKADKPAKVAKADANPAGRKLTYVVRQGDTLFAIARNLEVSVANLTKWNSLGARPALQPGQKLVVFVPH
jgi:membrane-bound lytic murein transglycosylase D